MEQLSILDPQSTEKSISNFVFISFSLKLKPPSPRSAYLYTYSNHLIIGFFMRLMNCVESSKFPRRVPSSGHTVYSPFVCSSFVLHFISCLQFYIKHFWWRGKLLPCAKWLSGSSSLGAFRAKRNRLRSLFFTGCARLWRT